jgi:carbon monoxide dehydrogenase subunit G
MHPCRDVGLDFVEHAPFRYVAEVTVRATPEQIFEVFEDAEAWVVWALPIQKVEWTSPKPFGVGTTRTVSMTGGMVGDEIFIAWERGRRMAFRFTAASMPGVGAFAEDYQVTELGDRRCRVRWVMALEPTGANAVVMRFTGWMVGFGLQFMLGRFRSYVETRYPIARAA